MGSFSLMHWVIVLLVVMLLFGGGRISGLMGDVAKGIKSFKKGMADDDEDAKPAKPATRIEGHRVPEQLGRRVDSGRRDPTAADQLDPVERVAIAIQRELRLRPMRAVVVG